MRKHLPRTGLIVLLCAILGFSTTYADDAPDDGPPTAVTKQVINDLMTPTTTIEVDIGPPEAVIQTDIAPDDGPAVPEVATLSEFESQIATMNEHTARTYIAFSMADELLERTFADESPPQSQYGTLWTQVLGTTLWTITTADATWQHLTVYEVVYDGSGMAISDNTAEPDIMRHRYTEIGQTRATFEIGADFDLAVKWMETRDDVIQYLRI